MTHKSGKIAELLVELESLEGGFGGQFSRHYVGFFHCFNRQLYYEAHDVLEDHWLPLRGTAPAKFYQGLIQLAGAFVHFKKNRLSPGGRLLMLALRNFEMYPETHEGVDVRVLKALCTDTHRALMESREQVNPWSEGNPPILALPKIAS